MYSKTSYNISNNLIPKVLVILEEQCNPKVVVANLGLPFEGVVLLVCQISKHRCLQNKVSNKFGSILKPKNCANHEKNPKIWFVVPWTENNLLIPFLLDVL